LNRFVRIPSVAAIFALLTLMLAAPIFTPSAHAQSYLPGVTVGNSVTFGNITAIWRFNSTPPSFIQQFNQSKSVTETVNSVVGTVVGASQTFNYKNNTQQRIDGTIDVQSGFGTLGYFILSGGLSAGDHIYQAQYPYQFYPIITETVTKLYAGSERSVNVLNQTYSQSGQEFVTQWDAKTGFLVELLDNVSYYSYNFLISLRVTSTNVWQPSTSPDFGFDVIQQSSVPLYIGETGTYKLVLNSTNSFSGVITLKPVLLNSTQHKPTISLSLTSVLVRAGQSNSSILHLATNSSTVIGNYLLSINGTKGIVSHTDIILVTVSPPDFELLARPANLTILAGTSKTSTITISSLGSFSGTVSLTTSTYGSFNPTILPTSVTLSPTVPSANATLTVQVPKGTAPSPYYNVVVTGAYSALNHGVYLPINVTGPDFRISSNPSFLNIKPGGTGQSTITLSSVLGFSSTVSLSTFTYQGSIAVNLDKYSVFVNSTTTAKATLTVSVPSTALAGYNYVYVDGSAGNLTRSAFVSVNVTAPDFRLTVSPSFLVLNVHSAANATINLLSSLGFQGTVSLSAFSYAPNGPTFTISPSSVTLAANGTGTSSLKISSSVANPGYYSFGVTGSSGSLSHTFYFTIDVIGPDFSISANPQFLTLRPGDSARSTISLNSILRFNGTIALSTSSYSINVSLDKSQVSVNSTTPGTATLTVTVPRGTPSGFYSANVNGFSGNLTHTAFISVNVVAPDFSISANPQSLTLRAGGSGQSTISLSSILRFNGTIALSASSNGLTTSLDKNSVSLNSTAPATATLTITVPSYTLAGYYGVFVTGVSGNLTHSAYVFVSVVAPGFRLSVNPSLVSVKVGSSVNSTITVTSTLGFSGSVTLITSNFFNGPSVTINPSTVTLTPNGTATATLEISAVNAVPGSYYTFITGASGNLQQYTSVTVNVIGPDFSMSSSPSYINLQQGKSASSLVTISRINNFNGTIALSSYYFGPSSGLTISLNATSVTLSSSVTSATVNVTITASTTATPNFYYGVTVSGNSGRLSRATFIQVNLTPAPEFNIFVSPSADFNSGAQGTSTITITPRFGFTGNVNITTTTSPSTGITVNCPSKIAVPSFAAVSATCTLNSTTPGAYTVTVFAKSGTLSHNVTFVSEVGDFAISLSTPVDFDLGSTGQALISLTSTNRLSGNITLTGSGSGLIVSCPAVTNLSANANVKQTCSVTGTVAGSYQVTIIGTAFPGGLSHSAAAIIHIGDFAISASSGSFNAGASGTSITISLTSTFNFAGSVNLNSLTSPSAGLTVDCPASAVLMAPNSTSTTSCILGSTSSATYRITVTGRATNGTASHDAASIIHVGDFAVSISPVDVNSGSSVTMSASLTSINNFAGPISIAGSTSAGLTVACQDAPISIVANSTITTLCSLSSNTSGTYSVTVTGSSTIGTALHSASGLIHVGDFSISITAPAHLHLGTSDGLITVNLTSKLNFAGPVVLFPDVSPTKGLTVTCPAMTLTANLSASATCMLRADTAGAYLVTIMGDSLPGTGSHSSSGMIQVDDFTISAGEVSPSTISAGDLGTSSITIAPVNGFTGTVTLAVSAPRGLACSFDRTTVQSIGTSTLSCTGITAGDYKVIVTAIEGSTFRQTSLNFRVRPAPSPTATSPTMFGLQLPQFFGVVGAVIVGITVAGITVVMRRKKP
jgi:uncharacterized membrane protein